MVASTWDQESRSLLVRWTFRFALELAIFDAPNTLCGASLSQIVHQVGIFVDGLLLRRTTGSLTLRRFKPDAIVSVKLRVGLKAVLVASELLGLLSILALTGECVALVCDFSSTRISVVIRVRPGTACTFP